MHLIFIRHGDPDYANDSVSEKGSREISLLAERAASWKVNECFVSPMGRAQKTAAAVLEKLHVPSETLPWLREFNYDLKDLKTGKRRIAWDWMPREYFAEKNMPMFLRGGVQKQCAPETYDPITKLSVTE